MNPFEYTNEYTEPVINAVTSFVVTGDVVPWVLALGTGCVCVAAALWSGRIITSEVATGHRDYSTLKVRGNRKMDALEQIALEDAITNAIEDLVHKDKLSRRRARYWYQTAGKKLDLPGLMLRAEILFKARGLKKKIMARRASGMYKPVALPEVDKVVMKPPAIVRVVSNNTTSVRTFKKAS